MHGASFVNGGSNTLYTADTRHSNVEMSQPGGGMLRDGARGLQ